MFAPAQAYEKLYKAGKAKAIGVSNYCVSCFECLVGAPGVTVVPCAPCLLLLTPLTRALIRAVGSRAVNQIAFHVGMGADPEGIVSYSQKHGIKIQAYSPLGDGALISDAQLKTIGSAMSPAKSSAQVALKYVLQSGHAVCTKADNPQYLAEDIDIVSWNLTAPALAKLTAATTPAGSPSWACSA